MRVVDQMFQDVRYASQAMGRNRGFSAVAIATLALGIAAIVTVFSFVDAIFLRQLPAPITAGDRIVRVQWRDQLGHYDYQMGLRGAEFLRTHVASFELVASHYSTAPFFVRVGDASREVQGAVVSAQYFPLLGIAPRLGRFFSAAEDSVPDRNPVAVISDAFWQSQYGGLTSVLGASLTINGRAFQIIGVAPKGFVGVLPQRARTRSGSRRRCCEWDTAGVMPLRPLHPAW